MEEMYRAHEGHFRKLVFGMIKGRIDKLEMHEKNMQNIKTWLMFS